jgi:hypothetical protein
MYRPKVGDECECLWSSTTKSYGHVLIIGKNRNNDLVYEWIKTPDGERIGEIDFADKDDCNREYEGYPNFRPLKSKRDEEIDEMVNVVISNDGDDNVESLCGSIHDAGYRKQMPYSQFVSIIQCYFDQFAEWDDSSSFNEAKSLAAKLGYTPEEN